MPSSKSAKIVGSYTSNFTGTWNGQQDAATPKAAAQSVFKPAQPRVIMDGSKSAPVFVPPLYSKAPISRRAGKNAIHVGAVSSAIDSRPNGPASELLLEPASQLPAKSPNAQGENAIHFGAGALAAEANCEAIRVRTLARAGAAVARQCRNAARTMGGSNQ